MCIFRYSSQFLNYAKIIALWESKISSDETAIQIYHMKRMGAALEEISVRLGLPAEALYMAEEKICQAFHDSWRRLRKRPIHLKPRKEIKDFYSP